MNKVSDCQTRLAKIIKSKKTFQPAAALYYYYYLLYYPVNNNSSSDIIIKFV